MARDTYVPPVITPSGTTWAQYKTGGLKIVLDNLIAANVAKANPTTQATVSITSAGSSLPVGTYFVAYTFVDPFGETTLGTSESASSHRPTARTWRRSPCPASPPAARR